MRYAEFHTQETTQERRRSQVTQKEEQVDRRKRSPRSNFPTEITDNIVGERLLESRASHRTVKPHERIHNLLFNRRLQPLKYIHRDVSTRPQKAIVSQTYATLDTGPQKTRTCPTRVEPRRSQLAKRHSLSRCSRTQNQLVIYADSHYTLINTIIPHFWLYIQLRVNHAELQSA